MKPNCLLLTNNNTGAINTEDFHFYDIIVGDVIERLQKWLGGSFEVLDLTANRAELPETLTDPSNIGLDFF